jgi:predicted alpha/beta-hydrolase family hydrolase
VSPPREASLVTPAGEISLLHDGPVGAPALVVLAHGAGGDMRSAFMETVAAGLHDAGFAVTRFNFPYAERGRKSPDRNDVLENVFFAVVEEARRKRSPERFVIGGKSMGGRIASQIAAGGADLDGLVFLGYPLHPPGRPERLRAEHLRAVNTPMLFVEGTRDPFCPLETLEEVRTSLVAESEVAVIADGDHSFRVRKSSGRSTAEAWKEVVAATAGWLQSLPARARQGPPASPAG